MKVTSSYHKIYERLYNLPECEQWKKDLASGLQTASIIDVVFSLNKPTQFGLEATASPSFVVSGPMNRLTHTESGPVWFDLRDRDFLKKLVQENFGKAVPTFNCDIDVILGVKSKKGIDSLYDWFEDTVNDEFKILVNEAKERVRLQYLKALESEEYKERKQNFLLNQAMKDIKITLSAYRHLGKDVLKEAIEEFVIHSIMDD